MVCNGSEEQYLEWRKITNNDLFKFLLILCSISSAVCFVIRKEKLKQFPQLSLSTEIAALLAYNLLWKLLCNGECRDYPNRYDYWEIQ